MYIDDDHDYILHEIICRHNINFEEKNNIEYLPYDKNE